MTTLRYVKSCATNYLIKAIQNLLPVRECRHRQRLEQVPSCWRGWSSRRRDGKQLTRSDLVLRDAGTYITLARGKGGEPDIVATSERAPPTSIKTTKTIPWLIRYLAGTDRQEGRSKKKHIFNNRHTIHLKTVLEVLLNEIKIWNFHHYDQKILHFLQKNSHSLKLQYLFSGARNISVHALAATSSDIRTR